MTIKNTFGFTPNFTEESDIELVDAEHKGRVEIVDGEIKLGEEILKQVENNPNDIYLVNKTTFDYFIAKGVTNIAMFDNNNKADDNSWYGGVITP